MRELSMSSEGGIIKLTLSVYGFAFAMALCAIIPGCNFLYSGHGGPAWLILPFVFPFALVRLFFLHRRAIPERRSFIRRFALISVIIYSILSLGVSFVGAYSMKSTFGLPVEPLFLWGLFTFPFGLVFSWKFFFF